MSSARSRARAERRGDCDGGRGADGRLAQPVEDGRLTPYLASDESLYVTGNLNLMDGGAAAV